MCKNYILEIIYNVIYRVPKFVNGVKDSDRIFWIALKYEKLIFYFY